MYTWVKLKYFYKCFLMTDSCNVQLLPHKLTFEQGKIKYTDSFFFGMTKSHSSYSADG